MPRSGDLAILVMTDDRQIKPIALPLVHVYSVKNGQAGAYQVLLH